MAKCSKRSFFVILAFLETLCTRVGNSHGHDHDFIQTENDLKFLMDSSSSLSERLSMEKSKSLGDNDDTVTVLGSPIKFEPLELNFSNQPLGMPILRKVVVQNLNSESSIQMLSISGNTIHFHCSFFSDKVIPPLGNTSFDVVFLGREEGLVENTLYIHTSAGSFRFVVKASGTPNPYRLKPLVGLKMPVNSSYSPMIELHNPHSEPIQVLEMYSSGGDLHLELPSGDTEGPQALWQIPPYQTKSVMKANFVARLENNHTAYIRIKTNTSGAEFLYLPIEIEVTSQPGLFCPQEVIDFGMLPTGSDPLTLKLMVLNSGNKPISVQNVIATPVTDALAVKFEAVKVPSDTLRPTVVAEVTFDPSLATEEGLNSGKIVIKSRNNQFKVTLPYKAVVLKGDLSVNETSTHFHLLNRENQEEEENNKDVDHTEVSPILVKQTDKSTWKRNITVRNDFLVPVVIHKISLALEAKSFFYMKSGFRPVILKPGELATLTELELRRFAWEDGRMILDSHLTLHTNISNMDVPLICFHGKLRTFLPGSPSQDLLDFGTLGMREKRDLYFAILNGNPVGVTLRGWGSNMTGSLVELMGVAKGDEMDILQRNNFTGMTRRLYIAPNNYMVFRIGLLTENEEGDSNGNVFVDTDFHVFEVPFKFRVAKGSLHTVPRELVFDSVFPGKMAELKLKVFSSFAQEMVTDAVVSVPDDPRFSFRIDPKGGRIVSGQKNYLGKVIFDPSALCAQEEKCYSGFNVDGKVGSEWFQGLLLPPKLADSDIALLNTLYSRVRDSLQHSSSFNITLKLDTDQVRGFLFKAKANLAWPRVTGGALPQQGKNVSPAYMEEDDKGIIHFPLTQVGNTSFREVLLNNPSDHNIYFHLVPFGIYPDGLKVANILNKDLSSSSPVAASSSNSGGRMSIDKLDANQSNAFRVLSVLDSNTKTSLQSFCDEVDDKFGLGVHADTKAFVLRAGHSAKVRLRFRPESSGKFRSALFLRNNLTGVEMMSFGAQSVFGSLSFGSWKSDIADPAASILGFEVKEKHLKDCQPESRKRKYSPPVLTVRRAFRMKNTGMTSVYVTGFTIEGEPCEGFGFKVLNCEGFGLKPEEQRDIDVAFTPDFTLSVVSRSLSIKTSMSPNKFMNFTMEATVPSSLIAQCSASLPRPYWEHYISWTLNIFMIFLLTCVLLAAYFESDRITKSTFMMPIVQRNNNNNFSNNHHHNPMPPSPNGAAFDLRGIPQQVNHELRQRVPNINVSSAAGTLRSRNSEAMRMSGSRSPSGHRYGRGVGQHHHPRISFLRVFLERVVMFPVYILISGVSLAWSGMRTIWTEEEGMSNNRTVSVTAAHKSSQPTSAANKATVNNVLNNKLSTPTAKQPSGPTKSNSTPQGNKKNNKGKRQRNNQNYSAVVGKGSPNNHGGGLETCSTTTESSANFEDDISSHNRGAPASNRTSENDLNCLESSLQQQQCNNKKSAKNNKNSKKREETRAGGGTANGNNKNNNNKNKAKKNNSDKQTTQLPLVPSTNSDLKKNAVEETKKIPQPDKDTTKKNVDKVQAKVKPNEPHEKNNIKSNGNQPLMKASSVNGVSPLPTISSLISSPPAAVLPKQKAKVTPVGKILPEPKKPENLGAQYGPIGAKPFVPIMRQSTWTNSPAEPTPLPHCDSGMFGPIPHAEKVACAAEFSQGGQGSPLRRNNSSPYQQQQQQLQQLQQPTHQQKMQHNLQQQQLQQAGVVGLGSGLREPINSSQSNGIIDSPSRTSLMQSLQLERRQRTEEYLRQRTDWPGFNSQQRSYLEDLWDRNPTNSSNNPLLGGVTSAGQQQPAWGSTLEEIWPTASWNMNYPLNQQEVANLHSQQQLQQQQQQQQAGLVGIDDNQNQGLGFNPLQLSAIWNSGVKLAEEQNVELQQTEQRPNNTADAWNGSLF